MCAVSSHKELQQTEQCPDSLSAWTAIYCVFGFQRGSDSGDNDVCHHNGESPPICGPETVKGMMAYTTVSSFTLMFTLMIDVLLQ